MKLTLTFSLPEEEESAQVAQDGWKYQVTLQELHQWLRSRTKHAPDTQPDAVTEAYDSVRTELHALLEMRRLPLYP